MLLFLDDTDPGSLCAIDRSKVVLGWRFRNWGFTVAVAWERATPRTTALGALVTPLRQEFINEVKLYVLALDLAALFANVRCSVSVLAGNPDTPVRQALRDAQKLAAEEDMGIPDVAPEGEDVGSGEFTGSNN